MMTMKKIMTYLAAAVALTACSSDIEPIDANNKTKDIRFSVAGINTSNAPMQSWADEQSTATPWSADSHANTLGVFGYADGNTEIFRNQTVTYTAGRWEYSPSRFWKDYPGSSFCFFGYMVENDELPEATVSANGASRTLSFPASISTPILLSADNTPLICHMPHHTTAIGEAIPFAMDHTLTGYAIEFRLDATMGSARHFVIKSVKVYGNDIPVGGTVSRTYTLSGSTWTAGSVTWTNLTTSHVTESSAVELHSNPITVGKDFVKWGGSNTTDGTFYAIPYAGFNPTIAVTYDVYTNNGATLSRKDITSNIILNKDHFSALTAGTAGETQTIKIAIAPDNLYVLADDDQLSGILVVGE